MVEITGGEGAVEEGVGGLAVFVDAGAEDEDRVELAAGFGVAQGDHEEDWVEDESEAEAGDADERATLGACNESGDFHMKPLRLLDEAGRKE